MTRLLRSRTDQRGVGFVELAIALPILLTATFGAITFGSAYNDKIAMNQGVRDAARLAARGELTAAGCAGTASEIVACLTHERIGGDVGANSLVEITVDDLDGDGVGTGDHVTVCAEATLDSAMPIVGPMVDGKKIRAQTTMRIETDAASALSNYSEGGTPCG